MTKWLAASLGAISLLILAVLSSPDVAGGITLSGFFGDDDGNIFEADIDAIASVGITRGCDPPTNSQFCPDDDVTRGEMAAFLRRALELPAVAADYFADDNTSTFEDDINAIASVGITLGCNPPANDRYCPDDDVDRGQMAAFLRRALQLPAVAADYFADDNTSTFEDDINAIASADITRGCNPPSNTLFCPSRDVTRGEMAAFLRRALDLPDQIQRIPVGHHPSMSCSKDGQRCSLTVDLSAGRRYRIQEGLFRVNDATQAEENAFEAPNSRFTLAVNGEAVSMDQIPLQRGGGVTNRYWRGHVTFPAGTHTLLGRWRWRGQLIQTSTITIRAEG